MNVFFYNLGWREEMIDLMAKLKSIEIDVEKLNEDIKGINME